MKIDRMVSPPSAESKIENLERSPAGSAELKRACQQFESFFALQLWRAMKQTVPTSQTTMNYTDMFDMQFADYLTQGRGLGLSEMLYQQLKPLLPEPSSDPAPERG